MTIYAIVVTIVACLFAVGWWHERQAKLEAITTLKDLTSYIRKRGCSPGVSIKVVDDASKRPYYGET